MVPGQVLNVVVTMRNTGNTTWTSAGGYALAVAQDDCGMLSSAQIDLSPADLILPATNFDFLITLTAPATPGTCHLQFRMAQTGLQFGPTVSKNVTIAVPANAVSDWTDYE